MPEQLAGEQVVAALKVLWTRLNPGGRPWAPFGADAHTAIEPRNTLADRALAHTRAVASVRSRLIEESGLAAWLSPTLGEPAIRISLAAPERGYTVTWGHRKAAVSIVDGPEVTLEAARRSGVRRLVFASSAAVYGSREGLPKAESDPLDPESPYAAQKLAGEHYLRVFHRIHGIETVAIRFFNVYGPRQDPSSPYSGVLSIFCRAAIEGRSPTIFGDGEQTRDFIFVEDIARLVIRAARSPQAAGQVYNGGTGSRRSLNETWEILQNLAGVDCPAGYGEARKGEIRHSQADISRARADLQFDPSAAFDAGLRRTLDYLRTGSD
jgi:UDP-glucose 4-epimerase